MLKLTQEQRHNIYEKAIRFEKGLSNKEVENNPHLILSRDGLIELKLFNPTQNDYAPWRMSLSEFNDARLTAMCLCWAMTL